MRFSLTRTAQALGYGFSHQHLSVFEEGEGCDGPKALGWSQGLISLFPHAERM